MVWRDSAQIHKTNTSARQKRRKMAAARTLKKYDSIYETKSPRVYFISDYQHDNIRVFSEAGVIEIVRTCMKP